MFSKDPGLALSIYTVIHRLLTLIGPACLRLHESGKNLQISTEDLLGRRRTGQVVKYLQPRARVSSNSPRRPLPGNLQTLPGRLRWAQLPAPGRRVRVGREAAGLPNRSPAPWCRYTWCGAPADAAQDGCRQRWDAVPVSRLRLRRAASADFTS